jgi:hypothetical protein
MSEPSLTPRHFADSIGQSGRAPLPDDHPVWRVIGAWIATRQRGDAALIRSHAVPAAADAVVADAAAIIAESGGPLRTGAELDVEARGRFRDEGRRLVDLDVRLAGRVESPSGDKEEVISHVAIAALVETPDGWRIEALLDEATRAILGNPAFRTFMEQQRSGLR